MQYIIINTNDLNYKAGSLFYLQSALCYAISHSFYYLLFLGKLIYFQLVTNNFSFTSYKALYVSGPIRWNVYLQSNLCIS